MLFFSKKSKEEVLAQGYAPYEQIDAKKTSKLGYFFLALMVIFGVWQGNNFLRALQNSIPIPLPNSECFHILYNNLENSRSVKNFSYYSYGPDAFNGIDTPYYYGRLIEPSSCNYTEREAKAGLPDLYSIVYPLLLNKQNLSDSLDKINSEIGKVSYDRAGVIDNYTVSLLEQIAKKDGIFNNGELGNSLKTYEGVLASLNQASIDLSNKIGDSSIVINNQLSGSVDLLKKVNDDYKSDMNIHELERFVLSLIFIAPLFYLVWKKYFKLKNVNSEYTIIWGGIVATIALIFAEVILTFVYQILPRELLQQIFKFLSNFKFFFTILYYLGFVLVPLFFGGLIYIIQKKYYNKKAVVARAFKAGRCPTCSMSLLPHMIFCSACGTTLKSKCASCGNHTPVAGHFCEICGAKNINE